MGKPAEAKPLAGRLRNKFPLFLRSSFLRLAVRLSDGPPIFRQASQSRVHFPFIGLRSPLPHLISPRAVPSVGFHRFLKSKQQQQALHIRCEKKKQKPYRNERKKKETCSPPRRSTSLLHASAKVNRNRFFWLRGSSKKKKGKAISKDTRSRIKKQKTKQMKKQHSVHASATKRGLKRRTLPLPHYNLG